MLCRHRRIGPEWQQLEVPLKVSDERGVRSGILKLCRELGRERCGYPS